MEMKVYFPGGKKVFAEYNGFTQETDQRISNGGHQSAPEPFDLFLASIGTCAGIFILGFCQKRGIDTTGLELRQSFEWDLQTHLIRQIDIKIILPANFPEKYHQAIILAAKQCSVKRHLENPPQFQVSVVPA